MVLVREELLGQWASFMNDEGKDETKTEAALSSYSRIQSRQSSCDYDTRKMLRFSSALEWECEA